jgi:hypothetical protein
MKRLLFSLLALARFVHACPGTEYSIGANCSITAIRSAQDSTTATFADRCTLETLTPRDGFNNLYRVVITPSRPVPIALGITVPDFVKAMNTIEGNVVISSMLWGSIVVSPDCPEIRASLASRAPAFEVRPQVLSVRSLCSGSLEVRIEERWGDFYAGVPSPDWLQRHWEAFVWLSHAK